MNPRLEKRNKELYEKRIIEKISFDDLGKKYGITKKRAWEIFRDEEKRIWEAFREKEKKRLGMKNQGA